VSWQATAWAVRKRTGSASRKVLLLVLANYADEYGICWPSQEALEAEAEMSVDTIQRQSKVLKAMGLIRITRRRRKDGTWPALLYQLNLGSTAHTIPQNAAWSDDAESDADTMPHGAATIPHPAADHAAMATSAIPQSLRHKPSLEEPSSKPSLQPSSSKRRKPVAERLQAFQRKQVGNEVIQHRIASRLGPDGWEILQHVTDQDLQELTALERRGELDDAMLVMVRNHGRNGKTA
jgi:hypothetical protein